MARNDKVQTVRLFMVRHGENPANLAQVFSNRRVDQNLTEKGILQAQQTADYFRDLGLDPAGWVGHAVYSSPLKRATETARIIAAALNLDVIVKEAFREIDVGILEQRPATTADWNTHQTAVQMSASQKARTIMKCGPGSRGHSRNYSNIKVASKCSSSVTVAFSPIPLEICALVWIVNGSKRAVGTTVA